MNAPKKRYVIAVDGPAASGKGTLARLLAHHLNMAYFDTGLLYRLVGTQVVAQGGDLEKESDVLKATKWLIKNYTPSLLENPKLRSDEAGNAASQAGKYGSMREKLVALQKDFAANPHRYGFDDAVKGAVLDGRDIGTVICPDADVKLYITASTEKRAERRVKELQNRGLSATYSDILANMRERDSRDASRNAAPMRPADDATVIDTSDILPEEVLKMALEVVKNKTDIK